MKLLEINGVDITPFIAFKGYKAQIEDLDASAERSMSGTLTRDRVARVPVIDVTIRAGLRQADVSKILKACQPAKIKCSFYNSETGQMTSSNFYAKTKYPNIYSTRYGYAEYESFTISLKGFGGI